MQDIDDMDDFNDLSNPPCIERKDNRNWKISCVLDAGHNAAGMTKFFQSLNKMYPQNEYNYRIVVGMSS